MNRRFTDCLFALLLLLVGVSAHGVAQASAVDASRIEALRELSRDGVVAPPAEVATESAEWKATPEDAPTYEISALESDGESASPSLVGPVLGCTAAVRSTGKLPQAWARIHDSRFSTSPVLARAPPQRAR